MKTFASCAKRFSLVAHRRTIEAWAPTRLRTDVYVFAFVLIECSAKDHTDLRNKDPTPFFGFAPKPRNGAKTPLFGPVYGGSSIFGTQNRLDGKEAGATKKVLLAWGGPLSEQKWRISCISDHFRTLRSAQIDFADQRIDGEKIFTDLKMCFQIHATLQNVVTTNENKMLRQHFFFISREFVFNISESAITHFAWWEMFFRKTFSHDDIDDGKNKMCQQHFLFCIAAMTKIKCDMSRHHFLFFISKIKCGVNIFIFHHEMTMSKIKCGASPFLFCIARWRWRK